jgi:Mg2+ and Co2+ transporter CorA
MAFRTDAQRPQAKIVVQAESHEQLNDILLALNQAVSSYEHTSRKQKQTASNFR